MPGRTWAQVNMDAHRIFTYTVLKERERQYRKWGDVHDTEHDMAHWVLVLSGLVGQLARKTLGQDPPGMPARVSMQCTFLAEVAAVAVAALEQIELREQDAEDRRRQLRELDSVEVKGD